MTPLKYPQSTRLDKTFDSVLNWIKIAENWIYRATKVINEIISTLGGITSLLPPDSEPTEESSKLVTSGGVFDAVQDKMDAKVDLNEVPFDVKDKNIIINEDYLEKFEEILFSNITPNIYRLHPVIISFYNADSSNYDPFLGYFRVYRVQGTLQKVACIYVGPYTIYLLRSAQGVISLEKVLYLDKLIFNL